MESLFTPWRGAYVTGREPRSGCFFCAGSQRPDDGEQLVVATTPHHIVVLNRYPYSVGHVMIAPREHSADPRLATAESRADLWPLVLRSQAVLTDVYAPHGFNLGMNVGGEAGAGVPEHWHFHVVPRWQADTNFMTVVGGARLIPETLDETWRKLRQGFTDA